MVVGFRLQVIKHGSPGRMLSLVSFSVIGVDFIFVDFIDVLTPANQSQTYQVLLAGKQDG